MNSPVPFTLLWDAVAFPVHMVRRFKCTGLGFFICFCVAFFEPSVHAQGQPDATDAPASNDDTMSSPFVWENASQSTKGLRALRNAFVRERDQTLRRHQDAQRVWLAEQQRWLKAAYETLGQLEMDSAAAHAWNQKIVDREMRLSSWQHRPETIPPKSTPSEQEATAIVASLPVPEIQEPSLSVPTSVSPAMDETPSTLIRRLLSHPKRLQLPLTSQERDIEVSSYFGARDFRMGNRDMRKHCGVDIPLQMQTPLFASGDGRVVALGHQRRAGHYVAVEMAATSSAPRMRYSLSHLHRIAPNLEPGTPVVAGETLLGWSGNSGWSTGPHVHFATQEERGGVFRFVNPLKWTEGIPQSTELLEPGRQHEYCDFSL